MLSLLRNYIVNIFKLRSLVDDSGKGDRNREIVDFDGESFHYGYFSRSDSWLSADQHWMKQVGKSTGNYASLCREKFGERGR